MNPTSKIVAAVIVMVLAVMGLYQFTQANELRNQNAQLQARLEREGKSPTGGIDIVLPTSTPIPSVLPSVLTTTAPTVVATLSPTATPSPEPTQQLTLKVKLYYKNTTKDPQMLNCNADDFVYREIPLTQTPLRDTINLLLVNQLTAEEKAKGFKSYVAVPDGTKTYLNFKLQSASITNNVATLTFTDPDNFSSGGSCRAGGMLDQIVQTAKQFPTVKEVVTKPDLLFQP